MALVKVQVAAAADTLFPRDRLVNTLHFESDQAEAAQQSLHAAIHAVYTSTWASAATREYVLRSYLVGPPPQYPIAETIIDEGIAPVSQVPREVALCLSMFSERNVPRNRGRSYLAHALRTGGAGVRPLADPMADALAWGVAMAGITAAGATWGIYSPTDAQWKPVTNVWVDDEWDTIRSRGLDATTRLEAAV